MGEVEEEDIELSQMDNKETFVVDKHDAEELPLQIKYTEKVS